MKVTSTLADDPQIGSDTDEGEIVLIAPIPIGSAATVKPQRKRMRGKLIESKEPSELEKLDPNWLDLPGIEVEGKIGEINGRIVVQAHATFDAEPPCTQCHTNSGVTKWSVRKQPRNIKDAERNAKLVGIVLIVQRYFCNHCNKAFTPRLAFLADGHLSHTQRLADLTKERTLERRTSSDVAVLTGLSRRAVQGIAREVAKGQPTPQQIFKRVTGDGKGHILQIDNSHPSLGECTAILLDGSPLELLEGYNEAVITAFFMTLDVEGLNNITCYVSDLAGFLLRLGRKFCPCATIVADPHHVIRRLLLNFDESLKPFREALLAEYSRAIDDQRIVRPARPRKGKRKNKSGPEQINSEIGNEHEEKEPRRPTAKEIRMLLHTKIGGTNETQRKALRFLLKRFRDVRAAYYYIQRVMRLYHTVERVAYGRDRSGLRTTTVKVIDAVAASRELNKFETRLPRHVRARLRTFIDSCRKNRDVICAFWPMGWTNADIESQNGIISEIDRAARCSLKFEELRRRWLYGMSMSAILERGKERVLGKKKGPQKKSTRELSKVPPPEPVPVEGKGGQLSLF